jgi:hypothetical protein
MGPEVQGKIDGSSLLYNEFIGACSKRTRCRGAPASFKTAFVASGLLTASVSVFLLVLFSCSVQHRSDQDEVFGQDEVSHTYNCGGHRAAANTRLHSQQTAQKR